MKHQELRDAQLLVEQKLVLEALKNNGWSLTRAAKALGVGVSSAQKLIVRLNLSEVYAKHGRHTHGRLDFAAKKSKEQTKKEVLEENQRIKERSAVAKARARELAAMNKN